MVETVKISSKIVSVKLATAIANEPVDIPSIVMHENISREPILLGATYKVKPPNLAAIYITINDVVLNQGTAAEARHPYEIFINSKDMEHFQWVVALTRLISAVFRKGGEITFMVEELKSVFDPCGGYFKKGGKFMPSLVAEIGNVIEEHLIGLGLINAKELSEEAKEILTKKKAELGMEADATNFPASAQICKVCSTKAVVILDGCQVCLNCGESKCS
jgi:hypothetical protein